MCKSLQGCSQKCREENRLRQIPRHLQWTQTSLDRSWETKPSDWDGSAENETSRVDVSVGSNVTSRQNPGVKSVQFSTWPKAKTCAKSASLFLSYNKMMSQPRRQTYLSQRPTNQVSAIVPSLLTVLGFYVLIQERTWIWSSCLLLLLLNSLSLSLSLSTLPLSLPPSLL